ncbi:MAG: HD domain-containing protein [Peptococcaceae bacterium]|nr:HD domain-containing protein [Peptococcaceae bacterium]
MTDIKAEDEYLFHHSVNVCVLALVTGIHLGYSKADLLTLGMGALLHDIGKVKIPKAILNKKGCHTEQEFEIIKRHPIYGKQLLYDEPYCTIAYAHHERYSGEGYPLGLKGNEIHPFA